MTTHAGSERATQARWPSQIGFYRSNDPWGAAVRVYERKGSLFAMWPSDGEELELTPLEDGWFAVGDPRTPRRGRFGDPIDGVFQSFAVNGGLAYRSFEG